MVNALVTMANKLATERDRDQALAGNSRMRARVQWLEGRSLE